MANGINGDQLAAQIPSLRRYVRALTRNVQAADDLVQDCLERAWRKADRWEAGTDLRAWLFAIMHNICVNGLRRIAVAHGGRVAAKSQSGLTRFIMILPPTRRRGRRDAAPGAD